MRSFVVALALLACACGDVQKVPDAAVIDAYVPDTATPLTCGTGEMVCNGSCANVMTSELSCGNCSTQCAPTLGCLNGVCVPANTSCQRVRELDPAATNGLYRNPNDGRVFYCDFTNNQTYEDFRIAQYDAGIPGGFALARATDFANPTFADAFIGFFNAFGGVRSLTTFNAGNCCISTVTGQRLQFGAGTFVFAGIGTASGCAFSYTANTVYLMSRNQGSGYVSTLPADFFTTNVPTEATGCTDSTNPAFFYRRRNGLN